MKLFYERLKKLGFNNYQEYLRSSYWKEAKKRYWDSRLPHKCLACGNEKFQLHHRSYVRLGNELPRDLIPLCSKCHKKIHAYFKNNTTRLNGTHKALRKIFGWSKGETKKRFRPFSTSNKFAWIKEKKETQLFGLSITGKYSYRQPGKVKIYKLK